MKTSYAQVCVRPVGRINYADGKGYTDTQMITAGRTPEELIAARFAHCGGIPAGWTATVTIFAAPAK